MLESLLQLIAISFIFQGIFGAIFSLYTTISLCFAARMEIVEYKKEIKPFQRAFFWVSICIFLALFYFSIGVSIKAATTPLEVFALVFFRN